MDDYKEILNSLNKPLIPNKPISNLHKIFIKYTSRPYYKYAFDLLDTLCNKTNYENKKRLLHMALAYLTIILYNCGNIPHLSNFDIMILCCFNLSIKVIENQKNTPCLNKLKKIYKEKFLNYQKEEIVKVELICIKLLNYKINIITIYDCLYYLLSSNNNKNILELATKELENQIINNIKDNINKKPLDYAKQIINNINKTKYPKILVKRKIVPMFHRININKKSNKKANNNIDKFDNNTSSTDIQIPSYMNNISKNNSPVYSHHNKNSSIINHNSKIKSNIYNRPISLVLPYTENNYSSYEKNKIKKQLPRQILLSSSNLINSFTNIDIECNNSPVNKTNCESNSPNGSDGISSFIILNNSGVNLTKNSSSGNVFKKPCLDKKNVKTFFRSNKKQTTSKNIQSDLNISQEYIFGDDSPKKMKLEKFKNKCFSNTFYLGKANRFSKSKRRMIKLN